MILFDELTGEWRDYAANYLGLSNSDLHADHLYYRLPDGNFFCYIRSEGKLEFSGTEIQCPNMAQRLAAKLLDMSLEDVDVDDLEVYCLSKTSIFTVELRKNVYANIIHSRSLAELQRLLSDNKGACERRGFVMYRDNDANRTQNDF